MAVLLIAEDDDDVCLALRLLFTRAGFTVRTAPDGLSALVIAEAEHPDIVLTDLDMPGLTGLQLCQAIRQHPDLGSIPVAILSGSLQPGDPRAAAAHVCQVILKPFANTALVAAVQDLLAVGRHDHGAGPEPCLRAAVAPQLRTVSLTGAAPRG